MKADLCDQHRPCAKEASEGVVNSLPRSFAAKVSGLEVLQCRLKVGMTKPRLYGSGANPGVVMHGSECFAQRV
jgi:hypothetical protein